MCNGSEKLDELREKYPKLDNMLSSIEDKLQEVEQAKEEDKEWSYYDNWKKENKNTNRAMSNRTLYVDGGYYYRVRCTHVANSDMSSSFTDGIYID